MKIFSLIFVILISTQLSLAQMDFPTDKPTTLDKDQWGFKVFRTLFMNLDEDLQELGITVEVCSYKNLKTNVIRSHRGAGSCIYEHFREAMKENTVKGVTHLWLKTKLGNSSRVRLDWDPTDEGWQGVTREIRALEFEKWSYNWTRVFRGKEKANSERPVKFRQNLLGEIRLQLAPGVTLSDVVADVNSLGLPPAINLAREVSFSMNPTSKVEGKINYQGVLKVSREVSVVPTGDLLNLEFKTNVNFLKTDRQFKLKGKITDPVNLFEVQP